MKTMQMLRAHLFQYRCELVVARNDLAAGLSPPTGFETYALWALSEIAVLNLPNREAAANLLEKMKRPGVGWRLADVEAVLAIIAGAIEATGGEPPPGSKTAD